MDNQPSVEQALKTLKQAVKAEHRLRLGRRKGAKIAAPITNDLKQQIYQDHKAGYSYIDIARKYGVSEGVIGRALRDVEEAIGIDADPIVNNEIIRRSSLGMKASHIARALGLRPGAVALAIDRPNRGLQGAKGQNHTTPPPSGPCLGNKEKEKNQVPEIGGVPPEQRAGSRGPEIGGVPPERDLHLPGPGPVRGARFEIPPGAVKPEEVYRLPHLPRGFFPRPPYPTLTLDYRLRGEDEGGITLKIEGRMVSGFTKYITDLAKDPAFITALTNQVEPLANREAFVDILRQASAPVEAVAPSLSQAAVPLNPEAFSECTCGHAKVFHADEKGECTMCAIEKHGRCAKFIPKLTNPKADLSGLERCTCGHIKLYHAGRVGYCQLTACKCHEFTPAPVAPAEDELQAIKRFGAAARAEVKKAGRPKKN